MWWDPLEEMRDIERRMNRLFRELWGRGPRARRRLPRPAWRMPPIEEAVREPFTDIMETKDSVIVTAELPGVAKEDIKINATEDTIEISAETREERKVEEEGYYRRERSLGKYYRSYTLPAKVKPDKAKATYKNGVLEVVLPKAEEKEKGKSIKID
jgi:HSP20 family protein